MGSKSSKSAKYDLNESGGKKNPRPIVIYGADQTVSRNKTWKHYKLGEHNLGTYKNANIHAIYYSGLGD